MRYAIVVLALSGCAALPDDGALQCTPDPSRACPDGFICASDDRCYRIGHAPSDGGAGDTATSSSCGAEGMSTECAAASPTTPLCGPTGRCVECFMNEHCESRHQTCDRATYACAPCRANDDCTSGYCNVGTGVCADRSTQLYVDNAPTAGCSDIGDGSFSTPFCTVQKAMDASAKSGGKPVVVFAGTYAEAIVASPASIGNVDYGTTVIGIGGPVIRPVGAGSCLIVDSPGMVKATITIDGFVFDGSGINDDSPVIDVNGGPANAYGLVTLSLSHATIENGPAVGLAAVANSSVVADAVDVRGNAGGGMRFDTSNFAVSNALIRSNGSTNSDYPGFSVIGKGEAGKTTLTNATVVSNTTRSASTLDSGIGCLVPFTVINTVIVGNHGGAGEVGTACRVQMTGDAFVGAPAANENLPSTCMLADLFADPGSADYHPKKGGAVPCTLVDAGTSTGAPDHDFDGVRRPQPSAGIIDVGAYEAR